MTNSVVRQFKTGALLSVAVILLFAAPCLAQTPPTFEAAMAQYNRGEFEGARAAFEKLAQAGDAKAQYNLGVMTREGKGGPKSDADAFGWFRKSADQGKAAAAFMVGAMYDHGVGITKSSGEAVRWYRVAADGGDAAAQFALGQLYMTGEGVSKDATIAVSWWLKAAEQGDADAQYDLGIAYSRGTGVAKDFVHSFYWMLRAEAQGNTAADEVVSRYRAYAGREELAEVRELEAARGSLPKDEAARVESTRLETAKTQAARIEAAKAAEAKAILDARAAAAAKPAEVAAAPTPSAPSASVQTVNALVAQVNQATTDSNLEREFGRTWEDRDDYEKACGYYSKALTNLSKIYSLYLELTHVTGDPSYTVEAKNVQEVELQLRDNVKDDCKANGHPIF